MCSSSASLFPPEEAWCSVPGNMGSSSHIGGCTTQAGSHHLLCLSVFWHCLVIVLTPVSAAWDTVVQRRFFHQGWCQFITSRVEFLIGVREAAWASGSQVLLLWWDSHAWDCSKQRPELHSVVFQWMFKHLLSRSASLQADVSPSPNGTLLSREVQFACIFVTEYFSCEIQG